MNVKQLAAEAALEMLASDMVVGLGTGSTAEFFLIAVANAIKSGRLRNIRGVPTSRWCEQRAGELGIPLVSLAKCQPDITVDGADEVSPNLDAIKGLGGALLREKVVAQNSKRFVIIGDSSKLVSYLCEKSPLPVEVVVFSYEVQEPFLRSLGGEPVLRRNKDGSIFVTDNGNYIFDTRFPRIDNPKGIQQTMKSRAGIVETGLFPEMAEAAFIGSDTGVQKLTRGG